MTKMCPPTLFISQDWKMIFTSIKRYCYTTKPKLIHNQIINIDHMMNFQYFVQFCHNTYFDYMKIDFVFFIVVN
jgi:hypothetical protein